MTMAISMEPGPVRQLELVPLDQGSWRLCDRSIEEDDPASVVAYVEETVRGIEVVWLYGRTGWSRFSDLGEVLRAAAADLGLGGGARAQRPIEIPHFAPRHPPH